MSISKRDGKYYCKFQINGERHHYLCKGATSKAQAEQMENGFKYKVQQQQNGLVAREEESKKGGANKIKLNFLYTEFMTYSKLNKISWKKDEYRINIVKKIWSYIEYAEDVKPKDIDILKQTLLDEGKSKVTVNRYLEILSKMFNLGKENEWLDKNPIKANMRFPDENYSVRFLTKEEEKRLLKVLPESFRKAVEADLNCGLRSDNILGLTWEQINLDLGYIEILKNKGNKHIILPINDKLYEILNQTPKEKRVGYVFINPNTGDRYRNISRVWRAWMKEAKIENFRFHDLRHTVGTRLAEKGVAPAVIKEVLAHSDIKTTMRYIHITHNQLESALAKL